MRLRHNLHLAYCTNIHRGESWAETFANLERHTLALKRRVCGGAPYGIGLRLGAPAALELSEPATLRRFQEWLELNDCYIFTLNGFPYGRFHGARVKEQVYVPDWTTPERLEYTKRLFTVLAQLAPPDVEGSVSTVPGSFKDFVRDQAQVRAMRDNLWACIEFIARLSERTHRRLHLGLEPEPLCFLETSQETVDFFGALRDDRPGDPRLAEHLGVNYDTCHLAVEFEEPAEVLARFRAHQVKISKIHLSSALRVRPLPEVRQALAAFADDTYLHQVVVRDDRGSLIRYRDLDVALAERAAVGAAHGEEWRIHFHIPLHSHPAAFFEPGADRPQLDFADQLNQRVFADTSDHLCGALDALAREPGCCSHLEMETYTWEVLPPELKDRNVVDQLAAEYQWTLRQLGQRGLAAPGDTTGQGGQNRAIVAPR
jgi:hypothetical protein